MGDGLEHNDHPAWDAAEADQLYDLLERVVLPELYVRDGLGIPTAWVARMRNSMSNLTPRFSADRAVLEYYPARAIPHAPGVPVPLEAARIL